VLQGALVSTNAPQEFGESAVIADGLPIGICVLRAKDATLVYANAAFYEILGSPAGTDPQAVIASLARSLRARDGSVYPENRLPFARALRERANVTVDDIVLNRADGASVFIRSFARPLLDAFGAVANVVVTFTDITEEVKARSRADVVEQHLQHVLSNAPLILFAYDRQGVITLSEGRGLGALGFLPKQLLGRSVYDLYASDPVLLAQADRVLSGEEFVVEGQAGSAVFETTLTPVRDANGAVDGAIGVCIDITERVRMRDRLLQSERLASMGTLAATVAHEINNPLTYVVGNLELVASQLSESSGPSKAAPQLVQWVNEAYEGAERVRRIVRDLQLFSRRDDDRSRPTDVHAVLKRALEIADNSIRHRARVVQHLGVVPPVLASDLRLTQVFVNLLLNAAQAIPEGHADANEVRVFAGYDEKKKTVVVTVEDTGSGIAPEVKTHLFEPFFTTKPAGVGTGLGLSTCYGIVSGFGGSIEVESAPGKGATFRIHLPATETESEDEARAPVNGAQLRRGHLLVVDDDPNVARTFAFLLSSEHDVEVSLQPRLAAERVLAGERFDIIFCDLMMPEMTGMDFYALIVKSLPQQAERIVFITGGAFTPAGREFVARVQPDSAKAVRQKGA
jgi:two-component system cell cycle sensor histidine kinase/response regulator CckA